MRPLRICLVSSECVPFAKTGGLADVVAALGRFLGNRHHDVRVVLPMYTRVKHGGYEFDPVPEVQDVAIKMGTRTFWISISTVQLPRSSARAWLVRCPELYEREGIYTQDPDEHLRFAMLARAAFALCQHTQWAPDVIHCNDWHTGLVPLYRRTHYGWDKLFANTRTLLTIHNIGYQGVFGADVLPSLSLDGERALLWQEDLNENRINFLKTGLVYADAITTVSRTYAREIQTDEFGMGLAELLRKRSDSLVGIVNGVDYGEWSPEQDALIPRAYNVNDLAGKALCKAALLRRFGLRHDPRVPVLGIVSRLTFQKGFELLSEILTVLLHRDDIRLVVLGSGEEKYQSYFTWLQETFPGKVAYDRGYKEELAHQIEAGADMFLMPSRFEPCGLNQMYSLKYGTVPIVRRTGGLADTVEQWDPRTRTGTGFLFDDFTPESLLGAVRAALDAWRDSDAWAVLQQNGMRKDFSWDHQGEEYLELYARLVPPEARKDLWDTAPRAPSTVTAPSTASTPSATAAASTAPTTAPKSKSASVEPAKPAKRDQHGRRG